MTYFAVLGIIWLSSAADARHVSAAVDLAGQTFEIPKKAFVLKLNKVKSDEDVEEEKELKAAKKKVNQVITLIPLDRPGVVKSSKDKNSELKILQELVSARAANVSDGSIGIGKLGSSKKGKLRFRIASGNFFSSSKTPSICSVGVAATEAIAIDMDNLTTFSNDSCSNLEETTKDSKDATSEPTTTEMAGETSEAAAVAAPEESPCEPRVPNRKISIVKIFKRMAEQFEQLQDLIMNDPGSDAFSRCQNKMTLESICCSKSNFTRIKFVRRKVSDSGKKKQVPKVPSN